MCRHRLPHIYKVQKPCRRGLCDGNSPELQGPPAPAAGLRKIIVFLDHNGKSIKIGKFCSISSGVKIFLGGSHVTDWVTTYPFYVFLNFCRYKYKDVLPKTDDVIIGNDVWIGKDVTIMSGAKIGDGCIIGTAALVTQNKQLPPYTIWGGVPAKQIGTRFSPEVIENLKEIKWWDWTDREICAAIPLLLNNDIAALIKYNEGVLNEKDRQRT